MKQTINLHQFHRAFETTRPDNFSYNGLEALFDYLEGYEDDTDTDIEFDVIGLCCDFSEYENIETMCSEYDMTRDEIEDHTVIIEFTGGIIIQSF